MTLQRKIEKLVDKYYPINWDDPNPSLENELDALLFDDDTDYNPIDDDIEEVKERIMDTLYSINEDRRRKVLLEERAKGVDPSYVEQFPKRYK